MDTGARQVRHCHLPGLRGPPSSALLPWGVGGRPLALPPDPWAPTRGLWSELWSAGRILPRRGSGQGSGRGPGLRARGRGVAPGRDPTPGVDRIGFLHLVARGLSATSRGSERRPCSQVPAASGTRDGPFAKPTVGGRCARRRGRPGPGRGPSRGAPHKVHQQGRGQQPGGRSGREGPGQEPPGPTGATRRGGGRVGGPGQRLGASVLPKLRSPWGVAAQGTLL